MSYEKKIAILGHTGFIGSTVYSTLKRQNRFTINTFCSNTEISDKIYYDIIINCAGMSKIHQTESNPANSYRIENALLSKISRFRSPKIIHISSICFEILNEYGKLKKYVENRIKDLFEEWWILRPSTVIGKGLKKNVVFDFQKDNKIFVTSNTIYNFISSQEIANLVSILIGEENWNGTMNVAASKGILVSDIGSIFGKTSISWGNEFYDYSDIDITEMKKFLNPKTSEEYIREYFYDWINK